MATSEFDSLILEGIHYTYQEKYDSAESSFFKAVNLVPGDPAPYLGLASLYGFYMVDFSTDTLEYKFFAYCDTTIQLAKNKILLGDSSGLMHLWLAGGYGVKVFYKALNKNLISAAQDAIRGLKAFYRAIELDSTLYDAYIGIAGYDYFKYRLLSYIHRQLDNKWETEIKLASTQGKYLRVTACDAYALLLIEEKRYAEAIEIVSRLLDEFPNSRTFRWTRVKGYEGLGDWESAKADYEKLLELTISNQKDNFYNIAYCRIRLANTYFNLKDYGNCEHQCNEIISLPDTDNRLKSLKSEAQKLLKKIKKD